MIVVRSETRRYNALVEHAFRFKRRLPMTGTAGTVHPIVRSHRDLIVWQKAMDMVDAVYDLTEAFPRKERYALIPQLTRAAVSVPANIAEGQARVTPRDFANFLVVARSSLMETETM